MVCVEVDGWLWAVGLVAFAAFATVMMGDEDGFVVFAVFALFVVLAMGMDGRIVCLPEFERAHNLFSYLLT